MAEALTGFCPDPPALDELGDDWRQLEKVAVRFGVQPFGQILRDVGQNIDAGDVHGPERSALRSADCRPCDRVDLFNGVVTGRKRPEHLHHTEQAKMVGDEIRCVLRDDDPLSESTVGKRDHRFDHGCVGL